MCTQTWSVTQTNIWFAGRLLSGQDRLNSIGKYFPYGEDRTNPSPVNPTNGQEKFATYTRDAESGMDYAYQRYYTSGLGRFLTGDPYDGSARLDAPQSHNRYAYVIGDPTNRYDAAGLDSLLAGICNFSYTAMQTGPPAACGTAASLAASIGWTGYVSAPTSGHSNVGAVNTFDELNTESSQDSSDMNYQFWATANLAVCLGLRDPYGCSLNMVAFSGDVLGAGVHDADYTGPTVGATTIVMSLGPSSVGINVPTGPACPTGSHPTSYDSLTNQYTCAVTVVKPPPSLPSPGGLVR